MELWPPSSTGGLEIIGGGPSSPGGRDIGGSSGSESLLSSCASSGTRSVFPSVDGGVEQSFSLACDV